MLHPRVPARSLPGRAVPWAAAILLAVAAADLPAAPPEVWAIRGARIVPVSGPVVERGTIVLRDGLIDAVGSEIAAPPDARVIDGAGLTVYPGFIDAGSDLPLAAPAAPAGTAPDPQAPGRPRTGPPQAAPAPAEPVSNLNAHIRAAEILAVNAQREEAARAAGFTTVLAAPNRGIFAGQSALVNLNGRTEEMVVRSPVAMHVRLGGSGGFRDYPSSLMGVLAYVKQTFMDARHYREAWSTYRESPRGLKRPETDRGLEALQPVIARELPLAIPAGSAQEIARALRLAEATETRPILLGGLEAAKAIDAIKAREAALVLTLRFPDPPAGAAAEDEPLRSIRRRAAAPAGPAALHRAGVPFALATDGGTHAGLLANLGRAVREGLPAEAALNALTLGAARLLGAQEQLGSLEAGKIANLVLMRGELFQEGARVESVFVDGRRFEIPPPAAAPAGGMGGRTGQRPVSPLAGRWDVTLAEPAEPRTAEFDIRATPQGLAGTVRAGDRRAQLEEIAVEGNRFRWALTWEIEGEKVRVTGSGTVNGDRMDGEIVVWEQKIAFQARRAGEPPGSRLNDDERDEEHDDAQP